MRVLDALVLSGFLATAFQWRGILPIDIRFVYVIAVAVLCYTTWLRGLQFNRQIALFLLLACVTSLLGVSADRTTLPSVGAQLAGITVLSTALFSYFRLNDGRIVQNVGWFMSLMFYLSVLAIAQEIAYLVGFRALYDINYLLPGVGVGPITREGPFLRVFSLFTEPGHFGIALTPAVFVAVNVLLFGRRFFYSRLQAMIVIVALLLTFSSVAYTGLLLSLVLGAGRRRVARAMILMGATAACAFLLVFNFRDRLITVFALLKSDDSVGVNASSFIFYINAKVALSSLLEHPLWGSGLGSHFVSYNNYIAQTGLSEGVIRFLTFMKPEDLNRTDAYSMLLRIPSELGLFGILSVVYFFVSNRVTINVEPYRMLSRMCIVFFLTYCVRDGNYFRFELWYFLALYAYLEVAARRAGADVLTTPNAAVLPMWREL
jgi:hypothetical protein